MPLALAIALLLGIQPPPTLTLLIRVFNGAEEVTAETRVNIFKAGERQTPLSETRAKRIVEAPVPQGMYDAQVIREREGRVVNIRWAERLLVMPYPDEAGRHLEVINFQNGFGALEVRGHEATEPDAAIFAAGSRQQEVGRRFSGTGYALFVVQSGRYDLRVQENGRTTWHPDIEVPADRTRLWIEP
jgi:hypothetical protein